MTSDEMKVLIAATMAAQFEADTYSDDQPTRATAHPPATGKQLERLEAALKARGLAMPPSFAQFLRIHDGIDDFLPSLELSLRSCDAIIDSVAADIAEWQTVSTAHKFVFASGPTTAFAGFLPESVDARGEMRIVLMTDAGEPTNYSNFEQFLEDQLSYYRDVLRGEAADREDLQDD